MKTHQPQHNSTSIRTAVFAASICLLALSVWGQDTAQKSRAANSPRENATALRPPTPDVTVTDTGADGANGTDGNPEQMAAMAVRPMPMRRASMPTTKQEPPADRAALAETEILPARTAAMAAQAEQRPRPGETPIHPLQMSVPSMAPRAEPAGTAARPAAEELVGNGW